MPVIGADGLSPIASLREVRDAVALSLGIDADEIAASAEAVPPHETRLQFPDARFLC
jgi:hypothetical protein